MNYTQDELAQLNFSAAIWLRMLEAREERVLKAINIDVKAGKTDFLALCTQFSVVREQIQEIKSALDRIKPKE